MQAVIGELNGFTSTCTELEAVRDTYLVLVTQDDPVLTHEQILTAIREDITPAVLYSRDALRGPHTIHRITRNMLSVLGVAYQQHPTTNRVSWGLPRQLFEGEEDREECYRLLGMTNGGAAGGAEAERQGGYNNRTGEAAKVMQAIGSKFRMAKDKFDGKLGESYDDVLATYAELCQDLEIKDDKKLQYMHHLFSGEALRFYRGNVARVAVDFDAADDMMKEEYNSTTRQNRCRAQLQNLRLAHVMRKEKVDTVAALEYIRDTITRLASQGPREYREEAHKREYLQDAVIGNPWATQCLATSKTENWSFQKLYTALDAAFLHHEQSEAARKRDTRRSDGMDSFPSKPIGTFFEGQSVYGRPRKPGSRSSAPYVPGQSSRGAKGQRLCFNCGEPGHFIRDCKKPQNIALTVASMVKKDGSNAKRVLYELSCQSQEAIFDNQQQEAYATMFGGQDQDVEGVKEENSGSDNDSGLDDGEEEDDGNVFYEALSPEDF